MSNSKRSGMILGIDTGPNSVGWAIVNPSGSGQQKLLTGVRVFEAGLNELKMDGKGKSRNVQRREARSVRRRLERTNRRILKAAHTMQRAGLLPAGEIDDPELRHEYFKKLDRELDDPYVLRARALDMELKPFEMGRALYHIVHRRGFKSNRKSEPRDEKEAGKVKRAISGLAEEMIKRKCRTLGEYCAKCLGEGEKVRNRYTSRKMYEAEFEAIWTAQQRYRSEALTSDLKDRLHHTIFHQRPLKSQKHLVGVCELEKDRRRAPWSDPLSQRFRYLQKLSDLTVTSKSTGEIRNLTNEERKIIALELEYAQEVSFGKMRKLLGLKDTIFNLEAGGEKKIFGNRILARIAGAIGREAWDSLSESHQVQLVEDVRSIRDDEPLRKRSIREYSLSEDQADNLCRVHLEDGYCRFSREALKKIVPMLEGGESLQTIIKQVYPERYERKGEPLDLLPPVDSEYLPELRNPIVERSLTEIRRVVNALIERHGKPAEIRIELGRELRQSPKERVRTTKQMRNNEKARQEAAEQILDEVGIEHPSRSDILKVQLAKECRWECPYTGKQISVGSLVGAHPQFDIEHIIPFERCLDDSFMNKTLCDAEENRKVKKKQTPFEAYSSSDRWGEMLKRVSRFEGNGARAKLRRFKMTQEEVGELLNSFTSRQLNDMRWSAKWAKKYLGLLYGGVDSDGIDADGKRRVQSVTGGVTAFLRNEWSLNAILSDGPGKSRDDHRHHAIDAVTIAFAHNGTIKKLSKAAKLAAAAGRRLFDKVEPPWKDFKEDVRSSVGQLIVSHRLSRRVRGPLHGETFYPRPKVGVKGKKTFPVGKGVRIRHVQSKAIHHIAYYELLDSEGNVEKWDWEVVRLLDAHTRLRLGLPVVNQTNTKDRQFLFSLAGKDVIELDDKDSKRSLFVVRSIESSNGNIRFAPINDARPLVEIGKAGLTRSPSTLMASNCRKVVVTPIGDVQFSHD